MPEVHNYISMMLVLLLYPGSAAAMTTVPTLSVDAGGGLRHAQLGLTTALLGKPALLEDLCSIDSRGADLLHHWAPDELSELQWSPLADAARQDRQWIEAAYADTPSSTAFELFLQSHDAVRRYAYSSTIPLGSTSMTSLNLGTASDARARLEAPRGRATEFAAAAGWRRNDELLMNEGWADAELASDAVALPEEVLRRLAGADEHEGLREVEATMRQLGYLGAEGEEALVLAEGFVSDELGKVTQALCVGAEQVS